MLLEYLFYGEAIRERICSIIITITVYSGALGKQIDECSIYQKRLRERKGDFKGKEFPLDYLVERLV